MMPVSSLYTRLFASILCSVMLMAAAVGTVYSSQNTPAYTGDFWPSNIDGTDCFPEYHRLMADQPMARVVDVMIPAGTAEIPHTHKIDSFMFVDQPTSVVVRNVDQMGNEKVVHQTFGDLLRADSLPIWQFMEPEPYHYVENRDSLNHYRAIRIEIHNLKGIASGSSALLEGVEPEEMFRKGKVALYKVQVSEEPLEIHSNDRTLFLIGRLNSETSVVSLTNGDAVLNLAKPVEESADRPKVWILNEHSHYSLTNQVSGGESVYLIELSP